MLNLVGFPLNLSGYSVKLLKPEDAPILQNLYEQCTEFSLLTEGTLFSPTEASDEFDVVPDGKTTADKYMFGLFLDNSYEEIHQCNLIGMIEAIRHYPDSQTWWIGLMMLTPQQRGRGIGANFYQAFEDWILKQGIKRVSLCAIEANELGLKFWKRLGFEIVNKKEP
jgi:GNAT superfamily N-acetyltransferase